MWPVVCGWMTFHWIHHDVLHAKGDVDPEEVLLLSGVLPGEAPWRLLLPH